MYISLGVAPINQMYRRPKVSFINLLSQPPGHAQCHTSLLATSSLGDGPWTSEQVSAC